MNILFSILHTHKQDERVDNVLETWGQNENVIFYSDKENLDKKVYKVSDNSEYDSGQEKQINVFKLLKYFLDYDWYFFCDNDTFVNTKLLKKQIEHYNTDKVYGEIIQCWPQDRSLKYPSGGAGFLISNKTVRTLIENILPCPFQPYSDVALGFNLRKLRIECEHSELFHSQKPEFYNIKKSDINNYLTFHYITNKNDMERFHLLCQ